MGDVWKQFAGGNTEIFSRLFLTMPGAGEVDFFDLFYGTEMCRRHTDNFLAGFDRLAELAKGYDTDNIILDTLITSDNGYLNVRMGELYSDINFE